MSNYGYSHWSLEIKEVKTYFLNSTYKVYKIHPINYIYEMYYSNNFLESGWIIWIIVKLLKVDSTLLGAKQIRYCDW